LGYLRAGTRIQRLDDHRGDQPAAAALPLPPAKVQSAAIRPRL
jgi:hypothetical protein